MGIWSYLSVTSFRHVDVCCSAESRIGTDEGIVTSIVLDETSSPSVWEAVVVGSNVDGEDAVTSHALLATVKHNVGGGDSGITLVTPPPTRILGMPACELMAFAVKHERHSVVT